MRRIFNPLRPLFSDVASLLGRTSLYLRPRHSPLLLKHQAVIITKMRQVASLIRRGVEVIDGDVYELPSWVFLVVLANVVVFFPVFIYVRA